MNLDKIRERIKAHSYSCWLWFKSIDSAIKEKTIHASNISTGYVMVQTDNLLMCVLFSKSGKCLYRLFIQDLDIEIFQYCTSTFSKGGIHICDFVYDFNLGLKEVNLETNSNIFEILKNEEIIY